MKKLLFASFFLLVLAGKASGQDLPKTRPAEIGGPTNVQISLFLINVDNVNSRAQSFTLDFVVRLKWYDDRLKDIKGPILLNSIWQPNVQIYNVRDIEIRLPEQATIADDGLVQYTQRYYATLSIPLDFREFPFDEQILPISLLHLDIHLNKLNWFLNRLEVKENSQYQIGV